MSWRCEACGTVGTGTKPRLEHDFVELLTAAELAVSEALMNAKVHGLDDERSVAHELVQQTLSLARTLVSSAKLVVLGGTVNRAGFVQGAGSRVDTLCAELVVRRELAPKLPKVPAIGQ